ncbi:MAG: hypothetical protein IKM74_09290 [Bacteroidales bacterium]|nr:hypothetical protein [Bacteroidales bacterium]
MGFNLDLKDMPSENYGDPLGESTGGAVIFGATGGVIEVAVRAEKVHHFGASV